MNPTKLLFIGGVPNDHLTSVVRWTPSGFDLSFAGNSVLPPLFHDKRISAVKVYLGGMQPNNEVKLPARPDVVFNGICNHESSSQAVAYAERFCAYAEEQGVRVINHPTLVRNTTREKSAEGFQGLDRILVPKITHLPALTIHDIYRMIEQDEIRPPFILRTARDHNGKNMVRIMAPEQRDELGMLPFDGRSYYAIPFVDYADQQGVYRKYRLVKVGNEFFGRHIVSSRKWNIHSTERFDEANNDTQARKDEIRFLDSPREYLGDELFQQFVSGLNKTGLDYVAVDFSLLPDGRAVFFECNACFNVFASQHLFPELSAAQDRITSALINLVMDGAKQSQSI